MSETVHNFLIFSDKELTSEEIDLVCNDVIWAEINKEPAHIDGKYVYAAFTESQDVTLWPISDIADEMAKSLSITAIGWVGLDPEGNVYDNFFIGDMEDEEARGWMQNYAWAWMIAQEAVYNEDKKDILMKILEAAR